MNKNEAKTQKKMRMGFEPRVNRTLNLREIPSWNPTRYHCAMGPRKKATLKKYKNLSLWPTPQESPFHSPAASRALLEGVCLSHMRVRRPCHWGQNNSLSISRWRELYPPPASHSPWREYVWPSRKNEACIMFLPRIPVNVRVPFSFGLQSHRP